MNHPRHQFLFAYQCSVNRQLCFVFMGKQGGKCLLTQKKTQIFQVLKRLPCFFLPQLLELAHFGNIYKSTRHWKRNFQRHRPSHNTTFSRLHHQFHYKYYVWVLSDMPSGIPSCWRFWPLLIQVCTILTTDLSKLTPCHTKILQGAFWSTSRGIALTLPYSQREFMAFDFSFYTSIVGYPYMLKQII